MSLLLECPYYETRLVFLDMLCIPWCHAYPPINISKDIPERYAHLNFPKKSILSVNVLAKLVPFPEVCGRHDLTY